MLQQGAVSASKVSYSLDLLQFGAGLCNFAVLAGLD